ncbi:DUF2947 domain-containing protein [Vibrio sp.]|uniref:DUF2947 family protein n=1 Tax=Vibrio viridaestus TaxID=2487322 RepID=A0A3N9TIB8_9VIBR|nr:DUF2947 domain-containing protein [Vibrio viridaestus]MDC0610717.1 DUF2947 domain-containing protein [Vibrio sp.]RQW63654.1 DUF2947 family protein [Vibrio viridaestus]
MSYISLSEYARKWIFNHSSMPVPEDIQAQIKPMSQARSAQFWKENISSTSPDSERLASDDWPMKAQNWSSEIDWMPQWESDDESLPFEILELIDWQDDVTVYFCYEKYNIIETKWSVFRQYWKNFLFYDDGPILLGRRRNQALWFKESGKVKLGSKE